MDRIKEFLFRWGFINQSLPTGYTCAICFDTAKEEDKEDNQVLPCGHIFHKKCIDRWIKRKNVCPICRRQAIPTEEVENFSSTENNPRLATVRRSPRGRPPLSTYVDRMADQSDNTR